MSLIYGSVCSGIEAATAAWHALGWKAAFFSEIEPFPCAVLAHHYPTVPNHGDMTRFKEWPDAGIDVLVGGTPCQSFSVAGLRKGLADPRGNLMLTFGAIAARYRPRWLVWENVPGVLSSNGGRDFGTFLGMLAELGYGFAYRILDAQFAGVPQRRRRVFVVGCLGDWRRAAAVLLERESLRGNPPPRREARERVAASLRAGAPKGDGVGREDALMVMSSGQANADIAVEVSTTLTTLHEAPIVSGTLLGGARKDGGYSCDDIPIIAHALTASGFDASEDGTGRGTPLVAVDLRNGTLEVTAMSLQSGGMGDERGLCINALPHALAFDTPQITSAQNRSNPQAGDPCHPLAAVAHAPAITYGFNARQDPDSWEQRTGPLDTNPSTQATATATATATAAAAAAAVRRLTPRECERLQGFPDDYTAITVRGKPAADGPRYKALGNSMAVPCMRWIGERIAAVEAIA